MSSITRKAEFNVVMRCVGCSGYMQVGETYGPFDTAEEAYAEASRIANEAVAHQAAVSYRLNESFRVEKYADANGKVAVCILYCTGDGEEELARYEVEQSKDAM